MLAYKNFNAIEMENPEIEIPAWITTTTEPNSEYLLHKHIQVDKKTLEKIDHNSKSL